MTSSLAKALDLSAIGLSALCLVHCLALPALALLLPALGFWANAEWVHLAFVLAAVPIARAAFFNHKSWRPHSRRMVAFAIFGLGLMAAGAFDVLAADYETPLTVVGGLVLAGAHAANLRYRHQCRRCGS